MAKRNVIGSTVALGAALLTPLAAHAQPVFTTLYNFQGYPHDGSTPNSWLLPTERGTLIGTTMEGGPVSEGTAFELTPPAAGGAWTETILHAFGCCGPDGFDPAYAGVVAGPNHVLYGTTAYGGTADAGVVYSLTPPAEPGGSWTETILYNFLGSTEGGVPSNDGGVPIYGVTVGPNGMLYGTNIGGGSAGLGTVFRLTPPASPGAAWTETILYNFQGGSDGGQPFSGIVIGANGALYGTTPVDDGSLGTVFEVAPPAAPGGVWTGSAIYKFRGGPSDGSNPCGSLVIGPDGAIYGATSGGGSAGLGTVFALMQLVAPGGSSWTESVIHNFTGSDGAFAYNGVVAGEHGVFYGATYGALDRRFDGTVYALEPPTAPGAAWTVDVLHRFAPHTGEIYGGLSLGMNGTIFGTTQSGGVPNSSCAFVTCGTVFSVIP